MSTPQHASRVVITGMGAVTNIGHDASSTWDAMVQGRSGITRIVDLFPAERSREVMSQLSFSLAYVIAQKLLPRKDGKGRVATYEVLKNVPAIGNLIRTGNWHQIYATMQLSAKEHMITMEKHLGQLVAQGTITRDIALQYANDPSQLQMIPTPTVSVSG